MDCQPHCGTENYSRAQQTRNVNPTGRAPATCGTNAAQVHNFNPSPRNRRKRSPIPGTRGSIISGSVLTMWVNTTLNQASICLSILGK